MGMDYSDSRKFKINRWALGDNSDFTIDTSGNVGIGTTTPQGKLHVADSAKTGNDVPLRLGSSDANPMELEFQRVGNSYFSIQSAERNVAYRNLVLNPVAGNVGIGTVAPLAKLDVLGDARISGPLYLAYSDNRIEAVWDDPRYHPYLALTVADDYTVLKPSKAGFRVTNYQNSGPNNLVLNNNGHMYLPLGEVLVSSDSRLKLNQELLDYGLDEVLALQPKRYIRADSVTETKSVTGKNGVEENEEQIGLVAQEVYEVIPEAVGKLELEGKEQWFLSYSRITAVLIKAIQEQQAQIDELKQANQALTSRAALSDPGTLIDTSLTADFDGDGKTDRALVSANGDWYFWLSSSGFVKSGPFNFGVAGKPVVGDFDGDGKADPGIVDSDGNWHAWLSGNGYSL